MKFILLTLFLYYIRLTSVEVAGDGRPTSCCFTVKNTKVPITNLLYYDIQNSPPCPIEAIRFHTIKHRTICSDPEDDWAKRARIALDQRTTIKPSLKPVEEHFVCTISTSTRSPTTTTPIKTTQPETETSTSTVTSISTVTSMVTTFKKSTLSKIRTTDTKPATVSTKSSQSPLTSTNPCTTQPTRERLSTTAVLITTSIKQSTTRKTPPKSIQRKHGKSKKGLRKYQKKNK